MRPELGQELVALEARRHRDDDATRIDVLAGGAAEAAGVEQAEKQIEQIRVRLLDLVDEENAAGTLERGEQRRRGRVPAVAGR